MARNVRIVTLTGASGAGKTQILKKLQELAGGFVPVVSLTTRGPRESDLPGEYRYHVPPEVFSKEFEFLWVIPKFGNLYGTLTQSVQDALARDGLSAMILVPDVVTRLRGYAEIKRPRSVASFYILSPGETEVRRRMALRGDKETDIEKRAVECREWDESARRSAIPYIFIRNDKDVIGIEKAARAILKYVI